MSDLQVILGANGQIGTELARCLHDEHGKPLRLVSRTPRPVNDGDELLAADLLDADQTGRAVAGAKTVYLTAGLPMDTKRWVREWPPIMDHVIAACRRHDARLVFFDNTYMYPQTGEPLAEETPFAPFGAKGRVRGAIAERLLEEMVAGRIEALIGRAPEFYGPGRTQSITQTMVFDAIRSGKRPRVFVRDDVLRTLIYTPDASRALAVLGTTSDAYGRSWHLPCAEPITYHDLLGLIGRVLERPVPYKVIPAWQIRFAGLFNSTIRDAAELLPRYGVDQRFRCDRFMQRFPDFPVTAWDQGVADVLAEIDDVSSSA